MKYDLHIHSDVSDGKFSREQIIQMALANNLEYIAFTEHNKFQPISILNNRLQIINGVEFDVFFERSFHALCYFEEFNDAIGYLIHKYETNTNDRSDLLIKNIKKIYKIDISLEELKLFFGKDYITKRDIIDWLLYNNYAKNVREAANTFTNKSSLSYVPKYSLDFKDVSSVINECGGKILLAHPTTLKYDNEELELFIKKLVSKGLNGIEIYNSSKMNCYEVEFYKRIADKYNVLTSCGSDFHGIEHVLGLEDDNASALIKILKKDQF